MLNSALTFKEKFYKSYFLASLIVPEEVKTFFFLNKEIQVMETELYRLKAESEIFIETLGDDSGRIEKKLSKVFEDFCLIVSKSPAMYKTECSCDYKVFKSGDFFVSYPKVNVVVKKFDGSIIASWTGNVDKVSSYTEEACKRMALNRIEKNIEEDFAIKFFK